MAARQARGTTLTRDRNTRVTRSPRRSQPQWQPQQPGIRPHIPHGKSQAGEGARAKGRLGSQQVVSVRGRRVGSVAKPSKFSALSSVAVPLLIVGIALAMLLSGLATTQTFTVQKLQSQERELSNQVESLTRDLEDRRSAASLAKRAQDAGMVVASEPGIVEVDEAGTVKERRAFNPEAVVKLVDVNGQLPQSARASSDDRATRELGDSLTRRPGGNVLGQSGAGDPAAPQVANLAPYQPNVPAQP